MFTDEKRFCLDGCDAHTHYWRDLRKGERFFSKRQFGGGSVMVWAGISGLGKTELAFCPNKMDSQGYQKILADNLLPFLNRFPHIEFTLQQDNAAVHASKSTKQWLESQNIRTLNWPARSPDLNCIENIWSILVRDVYDDCRQFESIDQLKLALTAAWGNLTQERLAPFIDSMPKRINQLIKREGKFTDY